MVPYTKSLFRIRNYYQELFPVLFEADEEIRKQEEE
jgi:hypothetical protein